MTVPLHTIDSAARAVCQRKPHAGIRSARMLAAITLLSTVLLGAGAAAVHAETEPSPAPTASVAPPPSPTPSPTPTPPPPALTINAPADGGFFQKRTITVSGDKAADSGVAVTIGAADLCTIPISPSTSWGCNLTLSSGADIPITATEILADSTLGD